MALAGGVTSLQLAASQRPSAINVRNRLASNQLPAGQPAASVMCVSLQPTSQCQPSHGGKQAFSFIGNQAWRKSAINGAVIVISGCGVSAKYINQCSSYCHRGSL